jgi:AbrB family looped-hinge helix DNA binding protein
METTRLSSKGQIVLPKSIRDQHNWPAGTEFTVQEVEGSIVLRPVKPFIATSLEGVLGCTGYTGPAKSLSDMERAIEQGVRDRHDRDRY